MSEGKHTPGPWFLTIFGDAMPHSVGAYGRHRIVDVEHYGYADRDGSIQAEQTANAHLIAAAPELLEALKDLHAEVLGECARLLDEDRGGNGELALRIEAAIAKAEGRP